MPTINPRINVTLSPSLDSLVGQFATIQRVSKSSVLREFMEAAEPQLRQALALMEAAKGAKPNALRAVSEDMQNVVQSLESAQRLAMSVAAGRTRDLVAEAESIRGRRPARSGRSDVGVAGVQAPRPGRKARSAVGPKGRPDPLISNRGVKSLKTVHISSGSKGGKSS
jgi:hypothetical protein